MSDGSPQNVPVWMGREGDRVLICTGEGSLKARNTARDPRVALSVVDFDNPYEEVQLRRRVIEGRPDSDFKLMDPISHKYTGKAFPFRSPEGRVALVIEIDKARCTHALRRDFAVHPGSVQHLSDADRREDHVVEEGGAGVRRCDGAGDVGRSGDGNRAARSVGVCFPAWSQRVMIETARAADGGCPYELVEH
jgi:PPOX class probable F420-dependent enzyme